MGREIFTSLSVFHKGHDRGESMRPRYARLGTMRTLPRLPLRVPDCTPACLESSDAFPESPAQLSDAPGRCKGWAFVQR